MYLLRTALSRAPIRTTAQVRLLCISSVRFEKGPKLTQGHATDKAKDPGHKDYDVQSASVRAGENARKHNDSTKGQNQPIDAARQGHPDGEPKAGRGQTAGSGPFMDQVGGQSSSSGKDAVKGAKEEVAADSWTDAAKKVLTGKTEGSRSYHTSAVRLRAEPKSDAGPASRQPKSPDVQGDQNPHLKHSSPSKPDTGKGNAAEDPSLPSKKANKSASGSATTEPSHGDTGKLRGLHTSARVSSIEPSADSSPASHKAPKDDTLKQDQNQSAKSTSPTSSDQGKGNVSDQPHLASTSTEASGAATHGAGVGAGVSQGSPKRPNDPAGQKRGYATKPPGGYSKALETEPVKSGYNAPPEALPSQLDSAYSPEAIDRDTSGLTPSSQTLHSSTASAQPNETLRKQALDGTLADRNPQPSAEVGELGNKEAWKHRK